MIRVGYDREIFLHQQYGGVSRGFAAIISEFNKRTDYQISAELMFSRTDNYYLQNIFPNLAPARAFLRAGSGWSTLATYGPLRELSSMWAGGHSPVSKVDIFHATYYRPNIIDRFASKKLVVTLHDFIPEKLGWNGFRNPHIGKQSLAKKADLIICVSEVTKNEAIERLKIDQSRFRVIPQGVEIDKDIQAKAISPERPYLIYVGHRGGYKNFNLLVDALAKIRGLGSNVDLLIVGPTLSQTESQDLDYKLGQGNWKSLQPQSDKRLKSLYRGALAHVVTSSMEGFGMTILEAMSEGTPVILNDIPIFREVASTAGIFFNPNDADSLMAGLVSLEKNLDYERKSQESIERAKQFAWQHTANLHAAAYHQLL